MTSTRRTLAIAALLVAVTTGGTALALATDDGGRGGSSREDVLVGRVVAAYVAPDEIVIDPTEPAGERKVLPVASSVDGYGAFTRSPRDAQLHRLTLEEGVVVAIEELDQR